MDVFESERSEAFNNYALANFMRARGTFPPSVRCLVVGPAPGDLISTLGARLSGVRSVCSRGDPSRAESMGWPGSVQEVGVETPPEHRRGLGRGSLFLVGRFSVMILRRFEVGELHVGVRFRIAVRQHCTGGEVGHRRTRNARAILTPTCTRYIFA